tara:strand:- start:1789 stop:2862 length:1074 start_codon:yes stop_codon:yes gene_type:complete
MFDSRLLTALISSCFLLFASALMADDIDQRTSPLTALDWLNKDKDLQGWCEQYTLVADANIFTDTLKKAKKIRIDYCNKEFSSSTEIQIRIINLIGDLDILFPVSNIHLQMHSKETSRASSTGEVAQFEVLDDPLLAISLDHGSVYRIENALLIECDDAAKENSSNMDCQSALKEFETIYNFAQRTYAQPLAIELSKRLGFLEQRWDDFYNKSKSQTLGEMTINGWFFKKENKEHEFAEPPNWQLVFMHPTIVVENVAGAIDGDQLKEAIMIEAIGADWWQQDKWFLPSGGALIATYSDRADVDDWGYGIAFNFNSKFTLGASNHDGDVGILITIDFLKLIQDKASIIDSYRESVDF